MALQDLHPLSSPDGAVPVAALLPSAPTEDRGSIVSNLLAGAVVAVVCLPFCIGFGLIAYAPLGPEHAAFAMRAGLVGGVLSGLLATLFGGTRAQISAPIIAGALLIAELTQSIWADAHLIALGDSNRLGVTLALVSVTVGTAALLQIGFGVLGLGVLVRYLAYPVVTGLMAAVAILTAKGQLLEFVGLAGTPRGTDAVFSPVALATLVTGIVTIAAMKLGTRFIPRLPGPLIGLLIGTCVGHVSGWLGGATLSIPMLLAVPSALPAPVDPRPAFALLRQLEPAWFAKYLLLPAFSIALFSSLNSLLAASAVDAKSGHVHRPSRELIGQGIGNLAAAAFAGLPGGGLASLSTLNWQSGGRTRLAGIAHGLTLLACLVLGGSLVAFIPRVVLAAVVVVAAVGLFDVWIWRLVRAAFDPARRADRRDILANLGLVLAVTLAVLTLGLVSGIVIGVVGSSAYFIVRIGRVRYRFSFRADTVHSKRSRPLDEISTLAELGNRIAVFELAGAIYFGSADNLVRRLLVDAEGASTMILGLRDVDEIDSSGLHVLLQFITRMHHEGRQVLIGHLTTSHPLWPRLADMGLEHADLGRQFFASTDAALEWAEDQLLSTTALKSRAPKQIAFRDLEILQGLPEELVQWLSERVSWRTFACGTLVVAGGTRERTLYFLTSGRVGVLAQHGKAASDAPARLASLSVGTAFGEIALLDSGPRTATIVAEADSTCACLTVEQFESLSRERPELALRLLESLSLSLARRLRAATEQIGALLGP